jgi:hypothetical protein
MVSRDPPRLNYSTTLLKADSHPLNLHPYNYFLTSVRPLSKLSTHFKSLKPITKPSKLKA